MASAKIIWNGRPGEVWVNHTELIRYQLVCQFHNSCGFCIGYHLAVSNWWNLGFHNKCRCRQKPIFPGGSAEPFESFRLILDNLSWDQKVEAIGASNFKLLERGVIQWEDVVTETRVRSFREIVQRQKLSIETMEKATVDPGQAKRAFEAVHTPAAKLIKERRQELIERIRGQGLSDEQIKEAVARKIAQRVSTAGGRSETFIPTTGPKPSKLPPDLLDLLNAGARQNVNAFLPAIRAKILANVAAGIAKVPKEPPKPAVPRPTPSTAKIANTFGDYDTASKAIFGRVLEEQELANLAGVPDGKINIEIFDTPDGHEIAIVVDSKHAVVNRSFKLVDGKPVLKANSFFIRKAQRGQGLGADVFGRMIDQADKLGIAQIKAEAQRGPDSNGYYTWPRFGYDGPLELPIRSGATGAIVELPASLASATRVSDLMRTPEGTAWWKTHGDTIDLTFDLAPDSLSRKIWETYRKEKAGLK